MKNSEKLLKFWEEPKYNPYEDQRKIFDIIPFVTADWLDKNDAVFVSSFSQDNNQVGLAIAPNSGNIAIVNMTKVNRNCIRRFPRGRHGHGSCSTLTDTLIYQFPILRSKMPETFNANTWLDALDAVLEGAAAMLDLIGKLEYTHVTKSGNKVHIVIDSPQ